MARLRITLVVVILPAALILSGCGRSPAKQAAAASQELSSWDSTARLANTARARGAIPAGFAAQVHRAEAEARAAAEAKLRRARAQ